MPIVLRPPEQRVVLRNVSWETYERLLTENLERSSPRFTYDRGAHESMSPSAEHERYNRLRAGGLELPWRQLIYLWARGIRLRRAAFQSRASRARRNAAYRVSGTG